MIETAHANLKTLLLDNADLRALLGGRTLTAIDGNTPVQTFPLEKLPAVAFELGDGIGEPVGIGGHQLDTPFDFLCALIWHEQDPARAFTQRVRLPFLLARAVMGNNTLSIPGAAAWVSSFAPDRAANHPRHLFRFSVHVELRVTEV